MKILQICKKSLYPAKDGEAIAIRTITKGLYEAGHEVTVLTIATYKHPFDKEKLPNSLQQIAHFDSTFVNTNISSIAAFVNLFSSKSYSIQRFYNTDFEAQIIDYLQQTDFDVVHLEGVYLATYIPAIRQNCKAPIVMRAHNLEFEIWERLAAEQTNPLKWWYMTLLAKRMKKFELDSLQLYDGLVPISVVDERQWKDFGFSKPCWTMAGSIDLKDYPLAEKTIVDVPSVFFIGSLDWMPNIEGLQWFFGEVWSQVIEVFPDLQCFIAGRNAPDWFLKQQIPNVVFVGEVPNAVEFMQSKGAMICPLFSGSGMRIKIIEAMALAKPIVATSIAAEGINCSSGENILMADLPKAFAGALLKCVESEIFAGKIGENAREFVVREHDTRELIEGLVGFYEGVIGGK
ncbi:MAG: glycosyltransferase family 4 protein [Chitinophagales bacterium]